MACGEQSIREALMCLVAVLDGGPNLFEWVTLFAVPVLVAMTTTLVAIGSWRTASKATAISEAALRAEEARAREQTDLARQAAEDQYDARLDSHFAAFFEAIGQFAHETDEWVDQAADLEMHWPGDPDDVPYPPRPSRALLDARLQATMLHARGDDRTVLGKIDGYVRAVLRSESTWKLSHRLAFLMELIRRWRDESVTAETSMSRLKRKRSAVESNRDRPPRRER